MLVGKGHFGFVRHKYKINRTLCTFIYAWLALSFLALTLWIGHSFLSVPPSEGTETRQYTECSDINASDNLCSRSNRQGQNDSSNEGEKANAAEYSSTEFIKEKRDLNAQEGMWRATNLLGYLTVLQVLIGIITIGVVWYTLFQTREILKEAKETTRQAALATNAAVNTAEAAESAEKAWAYIEIKIIHPTDAIGKVTDKNSFAIEATSSVVGILKRFGATASTVTLGTGGKKLKAISSLYPPAQIASCIKQQNNTCRIKLLNQSNR